MQLLFHLVYSPILYGKAKSAKRRKQQQQQQQQQKDRKRKKKVKREQVHVSIFKFQIQRFSCKNLQKSDKKKALNANILKDHANKLIQASY